uniref:Uncharacterized protein n=1 Tax=Phaseolus vulgaris TaxID=3885 RepID=Q69FA3_PHAVU|nr:hypothetical protein BA5 [Phaseolus vulgaris]
MEALRNSKEIGNERRREKNWGKEEDDESEEEDEVVRVRDAFLKRVELSYIGRGSKNPFQLPNPRVSVQPCNCGTACAEAEQRSSTFEGQGSAFPVMRPRSRVERATSAKILVLFYNNPPHIAKDKT